MTGTAEQGTGPPGVLAGLRVVDLSTLLAAPQIGAFLADLGARVAKVESPSGDPLLHLGAQRHGASLAYLLVNRSKQRVAVDLATAAGHQELERLVATADVVVVNQPPKTLDQWGCRPDDLLQRHPGLIVVTVSCYGWSGPLAHAPGNGSLAEAFGGLTNLTGAPDGPPVLPSVPLGDTLVGVAGAMATLAACWGRDVGWGRRGDRDRAPVGQHVDVSMFEPVVALLGTALAGWEPESTPPTRTGSRVPGGAPRNVYQGSDGRYLVLSATTDAQAQRALGVMGMDDPATQERFGTGARRARRADEIDDLVASWIRGRTRDQAMAAFAGARVPVAPVNDLAELWNHPQVRQRGSLVGLLDRRAGTVPVPGPLARFSAHPAPAGRGPGDPITVDALLSTWGGQS